jgi:sugar lactone lactonase YvrE
MTELICVARAGADCGEGPVWCPNTGLLYWVDITGSRLHCYDPARQCDSAWDMPGEIGSVVRRQNGKLLVALEQGLAFFDPATAAIDMLFDPQLEDPETRLNDAKCDRLGRLWVGTYHLPIPRQQRGALYRVDPDLSCRKMDEGFRCSNGPDWSPDDRVMYVGDSIEQVIYAYDFDLPSGTMANRRVFASVDPSIGRPDGLTVDSEGYLWAGHADGGRLTRYAPDGRVDRVIEFPVRIVTNCAFGGDNLSRLYVTTARWSISPEDLLTQPLAGNLFAFDPGVRGLPDTPFAG